ncbi:MAG: hypothetical protein HOQ28_06000 [Thermoleophilia bacterium]|nr:hypothetical protein [Thermoleophilia bacterium]
MNVWRLLVMRDPDLAPHSAAFDALLARTPEGALVEYDLPQPKWWFLHHLVTHGFLLHGSNEASIDEFETRPNFDAHNERRVDAVFASDDAIWPLYFAVVNRSVAQSYINWCEHPGNGTSRYLFSIGSDPRRVESWTTGTIYVLPSETFEPTPESRELTSVVPVRPRARLTVAPDDFPFKAQTRGHRKGATPRSVSIRHTLRWR